MSAKKLCLWCAILIALTWTAPSFAVETSWAGYVDAAEPICKANLEANEKVLAGVRAEVKAGKLAAAAKRFAAAAKALKRTRGELLEVPQPQADAAKLTKWLGYVKTEAELFEAVGRKLAHGEKTAAQKMVVRLVSNANRANNQVLEFGFRYCRFQPSKFV